MNSMTGFGRAAVATDGFEIEVSIRSVNGRFLDLRFHLPREYAGLESELKTLTQDSLARGTVDLFVSRKPGEDEASVEVVARTELARKWLRAYQSMAKDLKLEAKLSAETSLDLITRNPELIRVEESSRLSPAEKKAFLETFRQALDGCCTERKREGRNLNQNLEELLNELSGLVESVEKLRNEANSELEKRMRERLQKLGFEGMVDEQRMAQEIALQLDRSDINEEITRLRAHMMAYRQLLKAPGPQGKKMDFYAQELLREVNTIGSKSQIAKLTALVVDAKTVVERIREQVQNIE